MSECMMNWRQSTDDNFGPDHASVPQMGPGPAESLVPSAYPLQARTDARHSSWKTAGPPTATTNTLRSTELRR